MVKMGIVWERTTAFLGDRISAVLPIALIGIFVPLAIMEALQPLQATDAQAVKIGLGVAQLVQGIVVLWAKLAITAIVVDRLDAGAGGRLGLIRLPVVIGVALVLLAALALLLVPLPLILAATGADLMAMAHRDLDLSPTGLAVVALYVVILIPLLVFLLARLLLVTPILVAERVGLRAIPRSWRLTDGLTFPIIGVILLYLLVSLVAELATKSVVGTLLTLLLGGGGPITTAKVLTGILVAGVGTIFTVIQAVFVAQLYEAVCGHGGTRGVAVPA
ncbi:hypothetical protein [Stakelama saccharophila]|uniref:Glycerophosphoryl diester phosphodiesterase membrane domain-containing protein n=1 Tax=Stakelama saccharophila TaxID=3075605 RepID=A0ABZ0B7Y2_9SPHN|nr:hypothetical protein [Stakelama sp. W311]WNO53221.1 hypothetical protein RPR59_12320 [Stakelama sp. W311]